MTVPKHSAVQAAFAFSFDSLAREVAPSPTPEPMPPPVLPMATEVVALPATAPAPLGKTCKVCGVWKPLSEFGRRATATLGRRARCRRCFNAGKAAAKLAPKPAPDPVFRDADGNPAAKRCKTCREVKPLDLFHPDSRGLYGRIAHCKACKNAKTKAAYIPKRPPAPPVPFGPDGRPRSKACSGCGEIKTLDAFTVNRACKFGRAPRCRECDKAERLNPKPKPPPPPAGHKSCTRCGAIKPLGEFLVAKLGLHGRQAECKVCHVALDAEWRKGKPGYANQLAARRRARLLSATPPWLTPAYFAEMGAIYEACALPLWPNHEVDHILPLAGRDGVRGFHAPINLAIVEVGYNRSKGNRVQPGTERAEAGEFGTRWNVLAPAEWWSREWAAMGFPD